MVELAINYKLYRSKKVTTRALNQINYTFKDAGLYLISGESGCGKTTLLNCIGGLDKFNGKIKINSKEYVNLVNFKERKENISYIFQDLVLKEDLTVFENIKLFKKDYNENEIINCLKEVGIEKLINRKINTLSGGQKQRVGIARCFYSKPKIILADEPTAFLDEENKVIILSLLKKLSKESLVILVSHEKNISSKYADYLLTMVDGRIIDSKELTNSFDLKYKIDENESDNLANFLIPNKNDNFKFKTLFKKGKVNIISIIGYIITGIALSFLLFFVNTVNLANSSDNFNRGYEKEVIISKTDFNNSLFTKNEIEEIKGFSGIDYISPLYNNLSYPIKFASVNQQLKKFNEINYSVDGSYINEKLQGDIIYGRKSENIFEVVMDEFLANSILSNYHESITDSNKKALGINSIQNLINGSISLYNDQKVTIVGIAKGNSYCIYAKEELINLIAMGQNNVYQKLNLTYDKDLIGDIKLNDDEVLLDKKTFEELASNSIEIKGKRYKVAGYYESEIYSGIVVTKNEIERLIFNYALVGKNQISIIAKNVDELLKSSNSKYDMSTIYDLTKKTIQYSNKSSTILITMFSIIVFSVCVVAIFIVKRNELLKESEIYFFDLLYAKSKFYVFWKYVFNNISNVLLTAIPAFIVSTASINMLLNNTGNLFFLSPMPIYYFFIGITILFLFYIFISLITYLSLFKGTIIKFKNKINKEK